jgi:competence protein ComEA
VLFCYALAALCASACVNLPRRAPRADTSNTHATAAAGRADTPPRVNVNTASRAELERLPGLGPALARRIVEHRERHGPFRRAEHLLLVRGLSERRFEALRAHVTAE